MKQTKTLPKNRIVFFDNLRYLMVLLVLVFHSGASYTSMVSFWPFHEENSSNLVEIITILTDTFSMTVLFFIAGYFALPSLQKKGGMEFLKGKFKRLGIPWLVIILGVLPVLDYIHYFNQATHAGLQIHGYATHWLLSIRKFAEFKVGRLQMSEYLDLTQHFYQRYMWFLSLLFLFFIAFWLIYEIARNWGWFSTPSVEEKSSSNKPVYTALGWFGFLSIMIFSVVKTFASSRANPTDLVWFSLGNIFQFQMAKLAFYIPGFGLGVYAYSKRWFANGQNFGRPGVWGWIVLILMAVNLFIGRTMTRMPNPSLVLQALFLVLYPLWTLSFLGWFAAFGYRRWNKASSFNQTLASNSYNMYLVHYVFVMTLPLLLSFWVEGLVLLKFGIVAFTTIVLSYGVSRFLIRSYPRLTVLLIFFSNIVLMVFL